MLGRFLRGALTVLLVTAAPMLACGEDSEKAAAAATPALDLLREHRAALGKDDPLAAEAALTALREIVAKSPPDEATRKAWLEALHQAYGSARRHFGRDSAAADLADGLLGDIQRLVASAPDPAALQYFVGAAYGSAHTELGRAEAYEPARVELARLRLHLARHPEAAPLREELSRILYNEHIHRTREKRVKEAAQLVDELARLVASANATNATHENYLDVLFRESNHAFRREQRAEGFAWIERMRAHVATRAAAPPSHAFTVALANAYYFVSEEEPQARGDALLEEVRALALHADATEGPRDEYATMLGNAVYARHRVRAGEGIGDLLEVFRGFAKRSEATALQRESFVRALRNAALHYASVGGFERTRALRREARETLGAPVVTEEMRVQFVNLFKDAMKEFVTRRAFGELEAWLSELATYMTRDDVTAAELRVYADALVEAHLAAEQFGDDEAVRRARLEALAEVVRRGQSTPELLVRHARALDNRHYFATQRKEDGLLTDLLDRLRTTAALAPDAEEVAVDFAQALERSHQRALERDQPAEAAALLQELRTRIFNGVDPAGERYELLQALQKLHGRLGDAGKFAEADRALAEMVTLSESELSTALQRSLLLRAWADQIWDAAHKGRIADVRAIVEGATRLQTLIDADDPDLDQLPRVMTQALDWARVQKDADTVRVWLEDLRRRAKGPRGSSYACNVLARQLELETDARTAAGDLPGALSLGAELEVMAGQAKASPYVRRRWAIVLTDLHLALLRAGRFEDAPTHFVSLTRLDDAHAPEERHADLLSRMLYNSHLFARKRGDAVQAQAVRTLSHRLATREVANATVANHHADLLHTIIESDMEAGRLASAREALDELRTLAARPTSDERARTRLASALYWMHYHAGEAERVSEALRLKAELQALASRPESTWDQRDELAGVLADGVWDAATLSQWKRADAWTAELGGLLLREGASDHVRLQMARALRAQFEQAYPGEGRDGPAGAALDALRALCKDEEATEDCWTELAAAVSVQGQRGVYGNTTKTARAYAELHEICDRPGASEEQRDALAALLVDMARTRLSDDEAAAKVLEAGTAFLEELRALAGRSESTEPQQLALDGLLASVISGLVQRGRVEEADAALRRMTSRAEAEGATAENRRHHGRALVERVRAHVKAEELDAALAILNRLGRLAEAPRFGGDYALSCSMSAAAVAPLARSAGKRDLLKPYVELLERLVRAHPKNMLMRWHLEDVRK